MCLWSRAYGLRSGLSTRRIHSNGLQPSGGGSRRGRRRKDRRWRRNASTWRPCESATARHRIARRRARCRTHALAACGVDSSGGLDVDGSFPFVLGRQIGRGKPARSIAREARIWTRYEQKQGVPTSKIARKRVVSRKAVYDILAARSTSPSRHTRVESCSIWAQRPSKNVTARVEPRALPRTTTSDTADPTANAVHAARPRNR